MAPIQLLITLLYLLSALVTLTAAIVNWMRPTTSGLKSLALVLFATTAWSLFAIFEILAINFDTKIFYIQLENLASRVAVTTFIVFIVEYFHIQHRFTRTWVRLMWGCVGILSVLEFTNPLHHWFWSGFATTAPQTELIIFQNGPAFMVVQLFGVILVASCFWLLANVAINNQDGGREKAAGFFIILLVPMIIHLDGMLFTLDLSGINIVPIGFALSGLFITFTTFYDTLKELAGRIDQAKLANQDLALEIIRRKQLEEEQLQAHDQLVEKLSEQSRKISGLFDLVLLSGKAQNAKELTKGSLVKMCDTLGCDAIGYFRLDGYQLVLEDEVGLQASQLSIFHTWPFSDELPQEIQLLTTEGQTNIWTKEIMLAGFCSGALRRVGLHGQAYGLVAYFWKDLHTHQVDELSLMSTQADILSMILENSRLRQATYDQATLDERRRLARDLHDSVTQSLHSLVMSAETINKIMPTKPEKLPAMVNSLGIKASQALKEMRLLLYELRLVPKETIDLLKALQIRLDAVEQRAGVEATIRVAEGVRWPKPWDLELYPIAMEALNNALKYSRARTVSVNFFKANNTFTMQISDNGIGFDRALIGSGGMGLRTMEERATRLGGRLIVESELTQGTKIMVSIVLNKSQLIEETTP